MWCLLEITGCINWIVRNDIKTKRRLSSSTLRQTQWSKDAYRSILKTLYNGKKISLIPPTLVNNKLRSKFKEKANHFMLSLHLNALQSLMIVLYPAQQILFVMLVYHPFNSKTKIFLRLYVPLTTIKPMVMMIYL